MRYLIPGSSSQCAASYRMSRREHSRGNERCGRTASKVNARYSRARMEDSGLKLCSSVGDPCWHAEMTRRHQLYLLSKTTLRCRCAYRMKLIKHLQAHNCTCLALAPDACESRTCTKHPHAKQPQRLCVQSRERTAFSVARTFSRATIGGFVPRLGSRKWHGPTAIPHSLRKASRTQSRTERCGTAEYVWEICNSKLGERDQLALDWKC